MHLQIPCYWTLTLYDSLTTGLSEMTGSWQSGSKTYASPAKHDVTWRKVIADGWEKRQAILEQPEYMRVSKTKTKVEVEVEQMPWSELEEAYLTIAKTKEQSRQTGYGYVVFDADQLERDALIVARYKAESHFHQDDDQVSKAFKKKIKAMSLEEIKEAYPFVNSLNPYYDGRVIFNFDKVSKAEQYYIIQHYYELEAQ